MARVDPHHHTEQAALEASSGGCPWFFDNIPVGMFLPPLAVLVSGLLMALFVTRMELPAIATQVDTSAQAASVHHNAPNSGTIAMLFTPEVQSWGKDIVSWSEQWGLDPNLVATIMQIESCGDPKAVSYVGAMGLFQVMPYHFSEGENPYKPDTNAYRGLSHLNNALEARGGDIRLALAGYNGGIAGASRPENDWPAEMLRYVYWGTGIYADAQQGRTQSERLNEWLGRGGASLCSQAASRLGIRR